MAKRTSGSLNLLPFDSAAKNPKVVAFGDPSDSDLVLVACGQELHVHRLVLSLASPVFKAMLTHDFKEKDAERIELPGKSPLALATLMRMIYPSHCENLTDDALPSVFPLAVEYQIKHVVSKCEACLLEILPKEPFSLDAPNCDNAAMVQLLTKQVCGIDFPNPYTYGRLPTKGKSTAAAPWWRVVLALHHVATMFDLSALKEKTWRSLTSSDASSVWCSSIGLSDDNCLSSSSLFGGRYGVQKREVVQFEPGLGRGFNSIEEKARRWRFAMPNLEENPFFQKLTEEEKVAVLLAYVKFEVSCEIPCKVGK